MATNTINWGKVYETTYFGLGVTNNNINWGKSYSDLAFSIPSLLNILSERSDNFENRIGTTGILESFENITV